MKKIAFTLEFWLALAIFAVTTVASTWSNWNNFETIAHAEKTYQNLGLSNEKWKVNDKFHDEEMVKLDKIIADLADIKAQMAVIESRRRSEMHSGIMIDTMNVFGLIQKVKLNDLSGNH